MKIVLSVLAALVLLLLCPICLKIEWKKDFSATVGWLFLRFRLWPQKEKKKAAQQPKKPDAQAAPKAIWTLFSATECRT